MSCPNSTLGDPCSNNPLSKKKRYAPLSLAQSLPSHPCMLPAVLLATMSLPSKLSARAELCYVTYLLRCRIHPCASWRPVPEADRGRQRCAAKHALVVCVLATPLAALAGRERVSSKPIASPDSFPNAQLGILTSKSRSSGIH